MTRLLYWIVLVALSTWFSSTFALKILGISTLPSLSHHIWFTHLMKGLARNGHQIYALALEPTEFDDADGTANQTTSIVFEGVMESPGQPGDSNSVEWARKSVIQMMWFIYESSNAICEMQIETEGAKRALELVKNNKIDVIVHDITISQCIYGLWEVAQGNPAIVAFTPYGSPNWVRNFVGGNHWPAIKHYPVYPWTPPFNLWQKTINFLYYEIDDIVRQYYYMPIQQELAERFIGKKMSRPLGEIEKRVSVMLTNSYSTLDPVVMSTPNTIEVGGLHVTDPKPLSEDIKEFLDGAEHGVVVISLGTNLKCSDLGSEKLRAITDALSQVKQRVLWKFDLEFDADHHIILNIPKNVMIKKWIPQNDVLAHPKTRVLWSHSGLLSTQEAVWRGIPIIGMPFYMDQYSNIDLLVKKGAALRLDFESLTTETILEALNRVLTDPSFAQEMQQLSLEYRDRPMLPLDLAVWHIEYAARHPHGPLNSPGKDLNRFQLNLLDVYAFLGVAVLSIFYILQLFLRALFNSFHAQLKTKTNRKLKCN